MDDVRAWLGGDSLPETSTSDVPDSETLLLLEDGHCLNEHGLTIGLHQVKKSPRFPGLSADLIRKITVDNPLATYARLRETGS